MAEDDFELEEENVGFDFEDEFDRLRQKTARTSAVFDEMELEEEFEDAEEGFLEQITPSQRLILLGILVVDLIVIAIGTLAVFGAI